MPTLTDLVVEGEVSGDSSEPLSIQHGTLTTTPGLAGLAGGKVAAPVPVTGRLLVAPDGIRAEVDRPAAKGPTALLAFDTHDWTGGPPSAKTATASPPAASSSAGRAGR
jgi:hypothetical protein